MQINVFIDFDGTITKGDIGDMFFEKFGGEIATQAVKNYRSGIINAIECFLCEAEACIIPTQEDVDRFIDQQIIDPTFVDFINFCNEYKDAEKSIRYYIVSDGLDYYIERILQNHGLRNIPFFCNSVKFVKKEDKFHLSLAFPYTDEECKLCACCKRNHLLTLSGDEDIIVYIGEGYSDFCPAKYTDIVFAKDELQKFCQKENITYHLYQNFNDVKIKLKDILNIKKIKKRQQAKFNRRDILLAG